MSHKERIACIERNHPDISIARQSELLEISRASLYYEPMRSGDDERIMAAIDRVYTDYPFYGSRRIRWALADDHDTHVCREHVQRLMRLMGLEAVYPKKRIQTSLSAPSHTKYPYLLSGYSIVRPNQVWGTDITYLRLETGWCYLVAILDWFSRYVVGWELSATLETEFCITALERALAATIPEIHNSDQGVQFSDHDYTSILEGRGVRISMDGRGRCMDNIFTERLWRSVKYENVYLQSYRDIAAAHAGLTTYFQFYNTKRRHQALNNQTPADVYFKGRQSLLQHKNITLSLSTLSTVAV